MAAPTTGPSPLSHARAVPFKGFGQSKHTVVNEPPEWIDRLPVVVHHTKTPRRTATARRRAANKTAAASRKANRR